MTPNTHLDIGCGDFPRNPYRKENLYGLDIRNIENTISILKYANMLMNDEKIDFPNLFLKLDKEIEIGNYFFQKEDYTAAIPYYELVNSSELDSVNKEVYFFKKGLSLLIYRIKLILN